MTGRRQRRRIAHTATALLGAAIAVLLVTAAPAAAHGPDGTFQLQPSQSVGPLAVKFRVRLIYSNDTEPVTKGATVTVAGTGPGGSVGPVSMGYTGTDGYYEATVTFPAPGAWAMVFTSVNPKATYTHTESVAAPPTTAPPTTQAPTPTTAAPPTTASKQTTSTTTTSSTAASSPTTEAAGGTTAPEATGTTKPPSTAGTTTTSGEEQAQVEISTDAASGGTPWGAIALGAGAAIAVVVAGVVLIARRPPTGE